MNKLLNSLMLLLVLLASACTEEPRGPKPETLYLNREPKSLLFYGSRHSNSTKDPMFEDIEVKFHAFKPDYVLIEGGYNESVYTSKKEAVLSGEMAFVSFLTNEARLPNDNIDPPGFFVDSMLQQSHSSEAILTMYVLRQIYQYQREIENKSFNFDLRITGFANRIIDSGTLDLIDSLDFNQLFALVKRESNLSITKENWIETDVFNTVYNPGSPINSIYEKVLEVRDDFAIDKIMNSLQVYDIVFVIMGGDHLRIQREELKTRFNQSFK